MGAAVLPFTEVPRQTLEEEAGAGGVTAQADHMQPCPAQGSSGKFGGVPARWDLRVSPVRSSKDSIFIIRDS